MGPRLECSCARFTQAKLCEHVLALTTKHDSRTHDAVQSFLERLNDLADAARVLEKRVVYSMSRLHPGWPRYGSDE
ncbi:SWIM zinc finger family protein [Bradyrhizobium sp.]|uniref:SWIM zinc finger family protein n=1 Tax=Bradyrhizobium sp. TaxID=376 RepID=UPI00341250A3